MPQIPVEPLIDAAGIVAMLRLPGEDLVHLWSNQDVGFPQPVPTEQGLRWSRREVLSWLRRWGWRE